MPTYVWLPPCNDLYSKFLEIRPCLNFWKTTDARFAQYKKCRNAKHKKEKRTENERKKRDGLKKTQTQSMSTSRIQTDNLHFKANGNWLIYSLWRLVNWPICAEGLLLDTSLYHKSIILQIEWAMMCSAHAMTSNKTGGQQLSICPCALYVLKIHSSASAIIEWEA